MGTTNWAHIFAKVGADPDEANRRFLAQNKPPPPPEAEAPAAELGAPAHTSMRRQFSTIARRQVRLVVSDRAYFVFLALLPFVMGALSLTVPGNTGFGVADPTGDSAGEPATILMLLTMAAAFMGTALTHPRPHRRASHLPTRAGGRPVDRGLSGRQDRGVLRVRHRSGGDRDDHRDTGQGCADAAGACCSGMPPSSCTSPSRRPVWPRRCSACCCRRWPAPMSRSCRCWWCP